MSLSDDVLKDMPPIEQDPKFWINHVRLAEDKIEELNDQLHAALTQHQEYRRYVNETFGKLGELLNQFWEDNR
jgi:hypothetical protein